MPEAVYVEVGKRYSYAGALEWPGWCRHASGAGDPLVALASYGTRYRAALALSDIEFDAATDVASLEVTERLEGNSGTEYGVPSVVPDADRRPLDSEVVKQSPGVHGCPGARRAHRGMAWFVQVRPYRSVRADRPDTRKGP